MSLKAMIFDLDGTLLNTLDDLAASTNAVLAQNGFETRTRDEVRRFIGDGVKMLIKRALPQGTEQAIYEKILEQYRCCYSEHMMDLTLPYPGIKELLNELVARGIKTAVLSNKYDAATKALCTEYFPGILEQAVGESEKVPKKPNPQGVFYILGLLSAEKSETWYVGDSDTDIVTAKNAGLRSVGVTWGFRDRDTLRSAGAEIIVDSPEELLATVIAANQK